MSEPVKKRRQCGSKTKTGCVTCKIRRVKCDEAKPVCQKCSSTGRKCDGYAKDLVLSVTNDGTIIPLPKLLSGNGEERRGFEYFIKQTSVDLSGFYNSSFWQRIVLSASTSEPSLQHAVIAIGTLHEEFVKGRVSFDPLVLDSKGQSFAIKQYTKAIGHLRRSLIAGKQAPLAALMSCILFVCFDSLRGHFDSAMVHLQSGLKILRGLKSTTKEEAFLIETEIAPLFTRLSIQAILYIDTRTTQERRDFVAELSNLPIRKREIPEMFASIHEAHALLNRAADGLFRTLYVCEGEQPMFFQHPDTTIMLAKYTKQLQDWNITFDKFMTTESQTLNRRELQGAALLKIHYTAAKIMAQVCPSIDDPRPIGEVVNADASFVPFDKDFRNILNLSRSLILASEADARNGQSPLTFSTDLGVIGPLYYLCARCLDDSVRKEAVDLLSRCPRREGMWDSRDGVKLIREFWEIQEMHRLFVDSSGAGAEGMTIPLSDVVDLSFSDKLRWEWHWKDPFAGGSRESSLGVSTPRLDSSTGLGSIKSFALNRVVPVTRHD